MKVNVRDLEILEDEYYLDKLDEMSIEYGESFETLHDWFYNEYYEMKEKWSTKYPEVWANKAYHVIKRKLDNPDIVYLGEKNETIVVRVPKNMKIDFEKSCGAENPSDVLRKLVIEKIKKWKLYGV